MKRLKAMPEDDASSDSQHQADSRANLASTDFTAAALDALAAIDAAQAAQIPLALKFGEALEIAKRSPGHGKFRPWCAEVLRRSPTWCAAHLRLYRQRGVLQMALARAAASNHRWAHVHSVERLLRVIGEWRASFGNGDAEAARTKRAARRSLKEVIADLERHLAEAEADFIAMRDPLTPEAEEQVADLATASEDGAREKLVALARRFHWRPRDFEQMCAARHISRREQRIGQVRQPVSDPECSLAVEERTAERQCMSQAADALTPHRRQSSASACSLRPGRR